MHGNNPSVTLISHASVIIAVGDVRILTDPWQFGTAFNDSWSLLTQSADLVPMLDTIDFLWVSHEHPDHFHIPTLKSLPSSFKERVTVLFQRSSDAEKMVNAFRNLLGFRNVELLDHRKWTAISPTVDVYCYHSRQLDSALAVRSGGQVVLNLNDCEASERDLEALRKDLGPIDILLNQFSIAGFEGDLNRLPDEAATILDTMVRDHRALDASTTVPFASFVYFSCTDNAKINAFANTPQVVSDRFLSENLLLAVLSPGETYHSGQEIDNSNALKVYSNIYSNLGKLPLATAPEVSIETIETAFHKMRAKLLAMHGSVALRILKPVVVAIPDLNAVFMMSFRDDTFHPTTDLPDIDINSQPLHFVFSNTFGLQTLGVSGRYVLHRNLGNWFRHRVLFAMLNAGIGLSLRKITSLQQLKFFWRRRSDIIHQLRYRVGKVVRSPTPQTKQVG